LPHSWSLHWRRDFFCPYTVKSIGYGFFSSKEKRNKQSRRCLASKVCSQYAFFPPNLKVSFSFIFSIYLFSVYRT
jgi:hypothetical protein